MKISNDVKRMTSTGTVAKGTRARISRVLLTQLIASTALVAPFAADPAFAQSTLSIGSAPTVNAGQATATLTGSASTNNAAVSINNTGTGAALDLNFDGIIRAGTIVGATLQSAIIAGQTNITTSGTINTTSSSAGSILSASPSSGRAAVSIENFVVGGPALNLNSDGIIGTGSIAGATTISSSSNATIATNAGTINSFGSGTNAQNTIGNAGTGSNTLQAATNNLNAVTNSINGSNNLIGTTVSSSNTIGQAGNSTNLIQGATNTITGLTNQINGTTNVNGNTAVTGTLSSTGSTTLGSAANSVNTIGGTGSTNLIRGISNTIQFDANRQVVVDTNGTTVTGAMKLNNTLRVAGASTLNGATTINNTLDVNVGGTAVDVNAAGLNVVVSAPAAAGVALPASAPASSLSVTQSSVSLLQAGANGITSSGANTVVSGSGSSVTVSSSGVTLAGSGGGDLQLTGVADGIAPNAAVNRRQLDNVLTQLGSVTGITSSGGNTVVTGANSSQMNGGGNSVTVNSSGVTLAGSGGAALQLTGVADGTAPNSAVNRRQLDNVETEMSGGIASAMAMTQLPAPLPGDNYSVGLGTGFYNGESAFALGGATYLENGVSLKAAYSYSSEGGSGFGLGAGFSW